MGVIPWTPGANEYPQSQRMAVGGFSSLQLGHCIERNYLKKQPAVPEALPSQ
jgi:hypothetical protein